MMAKTPDQKHDLDDMEARILALEQEMTGHDQRITALENELTEPIEPPVEPPATIFLSVDLELPTGVLSFSEEVAIDLGDYISEFVHQRCRVQRQGPWVVFFRPDADGTRHEVVVEFGGWDFQTSPPTPLVTPAHFPAYIAEIRQGAEVLATVAVPAHWWMTRWRWQSAPRPVIRTMADLVGLKATLPLSEEALWDDPVDLAISQAVWSGPMGTGGLTTSMSTTGDRQELGPITSLQGSYLLRGNEEALTGMLAQAEAVGSFPFWVRDPQTNCLLDIYRHPYHATTDSASQSKYPKLNAPAPPASGAYFRLDNSHFPSVAYIPWLLTDDPYFLEGCQAAALYGCMNTNYYTINTKLPGLSNLAQKRGFGWSNRSSFQMAVMAPQFPPAWLLPRSLFQHQTDDTLVWVRDCSMPSQIKSARIFNNVAPQNGAISPYQEGFCLCVFGWVRWTGMFPQWHDSIDWLAQTLIKITADPAQGGWDRRWPTAYWVIVNRARKAAIDLSIQPPGTNVAFNAPIPEPYHDETPDSWAELWALYQQRMELEGKGFVIGEEDKIYQNAIDNPEAAGSPLHYMEVVTGALGALALGGVPDAAEYQAWMRAKLPAVIDSFGGNFKFSFRYAYLAP